MLISANIFGTISWTIILACIILTAFFLRRKKSRRAAFAFITCFAFGLTFLIISNMGAKVYVIANDGTASTYMAWGNPTGKFELQTYVLSPKAGKIIIVNTSHYILRLYRLVYGEPRAGYWKDIEINPLSAYNVDIERIDYMPNAHPPETVMLPPGDMSVQYRLTMFNRPDVP